MARDKGICQDCGERPVFLRSRCNPCYDAFRYSPEYVSAMPAPPTPKVDGSVIIRRREALGISVAAIASRLRITPKWWIDRIEDKVLGAKRAARIIAVLEALAADEHEPARVATRRAAPPDALAVEAIEERS